MTKTLLMVDHSMPRASGPDMKEVEAFVVGGLDGVFAIYKLEEEDDIYYFASGDDGNWWRIDNGLHGNWLYGVYFALGECIIDRDIDRDKS